MRVLVVTPPAPFVTLDEMSDYLGLGDDLSDRRRLASLLAAACAHIDNPDGWLGRSIGLQTLELRCDAQNPCSIRLPSPPVVELVSVKYLNVDGTEQSASLSDLELLGAEIVPLAGWPWVGASSRREAVRIRYRAGYVTVPEPIKQAVRFMIADMFQYPESVTSGALSQVRIPASADNLLSPFRVYI